jgi:hypothetical protein
VPEGQDFTANLNPNSLEVVTAAASSNPACATPPPAAVTNSSAWATSASTWIRSPEAGLQPHGRAARHLGQNRKTGEPDWPAVSDHSNMIILGIGGLLGDAAAPS